MTLRDVDQRIALSQDAAQGESAAALGCDFHRQFGLINIDLGGAGNSDLERKILKTVGSYGRQLGRIGDALEVILKHVKLGDLKPEEQDALDILKGQLASVRQVKAERRTSAQTDASDAPQTRAR